MQDADDFNRAFRYPVENKIIFVTYAGLFIKIVNNEYAAKNQYAAGNRTQINLAFFKKQIRKQHDKDRVRDFDDSRE